MCVLNLIDISLCETYLLDIIWIVCNLWSYHLWSWHTYSISLLNTIKYKHSDLILETIFFIVSKIFIWQCLQHYLLYICELFGEVSKHYVLSDILPRLKHVGFWRYLAFFKHCVVGYQCSHRVHLFLYTINHAFLTECDVECCIHISMINVPANRTLKLLSSPLTSSTTPRAILRCVCRINVENRDAKQLGFVFYELL